MCSMSEFDRSFVFVFDDDEDEDDSPFDKIFTLLSSTDVRIATAASSFMKNIKMFCSTKRVSFVSVYFLVCFSLGLEGLKKIGFVCSVSSLLYPRAPLFEKHVLHHHRRCKFILHVPPRSQSYRVSRAGGLHIRLQPRSR